MQCNANHARIGVDELSDQRKKVHLGHPFPKSPSTKDPSESAHDHRARKTKRRLACWPAYRPPGAEAKPKRHAKAKHVGHQVLKVGTGGVDHLWRSARQAVMHRQRENAGGDRQPEYESVTKTPYQASAGLTARGAATSPKTTP